MNECSETQARQKQFFKAGIVGRQTCERAILANRGLQERESLIDVATMHLEAGAAIDSGGLLRGSKK